VFINSATECSNPNIWNLDGAAEKCSLTACFPELIHPITAVISNISYQGDYQSN